MAFHSVRGRTGPDGVARPAASREIGDELARLYAEHSRRLLQLAALLVPDLGAAREIMYEAFAALDARRARPRSSGDAFGFLLRTVVRRSRTVILAECPAQNPVLDALRSLPLIQREALVLHCYGRLPDWQAAEAMGIRSAELRAHVEWGLAALRDKLANDHLRCLLLCCDGGRRRLGADT